MKAPLLVLVPLLASIVGACSRAGTSHRSDATKAAHVVALTHSGSDTWTCSLELPPTATALATVPADLAVRAIIPSYDPTTRRARVRDRVVEGCFGVTASAEWLADVDPGGTPRPGEVRVVDRFALTSDREAFWLTTGCSEGGALQEERGLLALLRLDGRRLVVDAVGAWANVASTRRLERYLVAGQEVFLEGKHFEGTGACCGADGAIVWVHEGHSLRIAGEVVTTAFAGVDESPACDWDGRLSSQISGGGALTLTQTVTWTRKKGDGTVCADRPAVRRERVRVLDLVEGHLVERGDAGAPNPLESDRPR